MTYLIRLKNRDFSAIKSARVLLSTSVADGLLAYYETRHAADYALTNVATGAVDGKIIGAPTFTESHATVSQLNAIEFGTKPSASPSRTWAAIIRLLIENENPGSPVGSFVPSATTNGAEYLLTKGLNLIYEATVFDVNNVFAGSVRTPAINMALNTYDLLLARVTSQQKVELIRPRTGETKTVTTTKSLAFTASAGNYRATINTANANKNIALFAHWNRPLTDQEIAAFYAEQKARFSGIFEI